MHWDTSRWLRREANTPDLEEIHMANNGRIEAWSAERLARGLGWFSIGLGLAELSSAAGGTIHWRQSKHELLLRLLGMRELASGLVF